MLFSANRIFTNKGKFLLVMAVLILGLLWIGNWANDEKRVHTAFHQTLAGIEGGQWRAVERRLHEDYRDPWSEERDHAVRVVRGIANQFTELQLEAREVNIRIEDDFALITCSIHVEGEGSPFAVSAMHKWNQQASELTLRLKKTGMWPGSWKIIRVEMDDPPRF